LGLAERIRPHSSSRTQSDGSVSPVSEQTPLILTVLPIKARRAFSSMGGRADMSSSRLGTGSIKQAVRHVALITEGPAYSTCIPPPMPVDDTVKMLEPDADSKGNCTDSAMRSLNRKAAGDESGPMGMKRESWMVRR